MIIVSGMGVTWEEVKVLYTYTLSPLGVADPLWHINVNSS